MADQFETFNIMVRPLFHYHELRGQVLKEKFVQIDELLRKGIKLLLSTTTFVEDNLCFELAEIAIGSIKRKVYRGRQVLNKSDIGQGVEVGAENARVLSIGFDLFKLSRLSREIAPPLIFRILRSLRLSNDRYEKIIRAFIKQTASYQDTILNLTKLQQVLQDSTESEIVLVPTMKKISQLIDEKTRIEQAVSCADPKFLYGVVGCINYLITKISRIQEDIVKAYLKLVPGIVRESAKSDKDALDMFQAGSLGLLHAVSVYDYRSRAGFPGIARHWVRQKVKGALRKSAGTLIRLPQNMWECYWDIKRAQRAILQQNPHVEITHAILAKKLSWPVEKVDNVLNTVNLAQVGSLDDDGDFEDESSIERAATIPDTSLDDNEKWQEQREYLLQMIEHLSYEERRLVCLRYGLLDGIDNDHLDFQESFNEILRQLACKTLLNQWLAGRIDKVNSIPILANEGEDKHE